jgi:sugar phosphate permease
VLAPALRDEFGLTLGEVGLLLASQWVGPVLTLLPWGLLADRVGERLVLVLGLTGSAVCLVGAALVDRFAALVVLLSVGSAAGASVNSASGRAVMNWFDARERGFALGLRQTAIPLGGVIGALGLPPVEHAWGVQAAFAALAVLGFAGAIAGWLVVRDRGREGVEAEAVPWTLRDARLWRLCTGSGLFLVAQVAMMSFVVLFLVDERGLSNGEAAGVLAVAQAVAVVLRIGAGRWSDRLGARIVPLRRIGLAIAATGALSALLTEAALVLLLPALVAAAALSMAWNGLSFTAAAELAGRARAGAAIGFQQTALSLVGAGVPVAFAATVSVSSWGFAFGAAALFPLLGWWALGPLAERR